ncbi:endonuclease/exonuclease/phosphatase family protein [Carboxylicivirga mesophila]|uniref:Endonuclease/exonuclease/phosphatase family protein n=1 Tax=Carboxylicivirga mesophila TaxID=1166478 RepID=A0ABS5K4T4_9BACT|nr:endonuclease/exonuclease/phosphatase family protein [Carboxylicivirga mesophila]MBS2210019.1 endonuclease/exonuclease/phosphatase family protein [Carboxylicivirga mesophila]
MKLLTCISLSFILLTGNCILCRGNDIEASQSLSVSVMVWNIWHGGNDADLKEDGRPHVIDIIKSVNPDIVLLIETYGSGKMIADSLGYYFHLIDKPGTPLDNPHTNLSILSRYPLGERVDFYNYFNVGGIEVYLNDTTKMMVFDTWLNFDPWDDEPQLLGKTPDELVKWETSGSRPKEVGAILKGLQPFLDNADDVPVIVGGDFNIWSHRDWVESNKGINNDLVVNWWTLSAFEDAGLKDAFREKYPNPKHNPGISWGMPGVNDDHRIDYILYKGNKLKVLDSQIRKVDYNETIVIGNKSAMFPSDHGYVVTHFQLDL